MKAMMLRIGSAVALGTTGVALAFGGDPDQFFWEDAIDGNWSCAGCWDPDGPPLSATDAARIDVTGSAYTINLDVNPMIEGFTMDSVDARLVLNGAGDVMTVLAQQAQSQSVILAGEVELQNDSSWVTGNAFRINGANSLLELRSDTSLTAEEVLVEDSGLLLAGAGLSSITTTGNVNIEPGAMIEINTTDDLAFDVGGELNGGGPVFVEGTGQLRVIDLTIGADGLVELDTTGNPGVRGLSSNEVLTNHGTIRGAGKVGEDALSVVNTGLIEADTPATTLVVRMNGAGMMNTGTLRASNGATLNIQDSEIFNDGGVIEALDGSFVDLNDQPLVIRDGTLRTEGTGRIRDITSTGTINLHDVTIDGTFEINDQAETRMDGTITNLGEILMTAGGPTELLIIDEVMLTGGGTLCMTDDPSNFIGGVSGGAKHEVFTNVDNTIMGSGTIGGQTFIWHNQGTIIANQATELELVLADDDESNSGELIATDGGTLHLMGGVIDNAGGVIRAEDKSLVYFDTTPGVNGGTLETTGSGVIRDETTTGNTTLTDVTNLGHYDIQNQAETRIVGSLVNNGMITMSSIGNTTELKLGDGVALNGGGEIVMSDSEDNRILAFGPTASVTNTDNTIRGAGDIGFNTLSLLNLGTIIADQPTVLMINPDNDGLFLNGGTLEATGAGGLEIVRGPFETNGTVHIGPGSQLRRNNEQQSDYVQTGGETIVHGLLHVEDGNLVTIAGGVLSGDGVVEGILDNTGGTIAPGSSAGLLSVAGDYQTSTGGALAIELGGYTGGTEHDLVNVSGTATLGGRLAVSTIEEFVPQIGDTFVILSATEVVGSFECFSLENLKGAKFIVTHDGEDVTLSVVAGPSCAEDLNFDGQIDTIDLLILLGSWGETGGCASADLNGDDVVDTIDLLQLLGGWGSCV